MEIEGKHSFWLEGQLFLRLCLVCTVDYKCKRLCLDGPPYLHKRKVLDQIRKMTKIIFVTGWGK